MHALGKEQKRKVKDGSSNAKEDRSTRKQPKAREDEQFRLTSEGQWQMTEEDPKSAAISNKMTGVRAYVFHPRVSDLGDECRKVADLLHAVDVIGR